MRTYTITDKQISAIHNGICEIRFLMSHFEEMFKEDSHLNQKLKRAFEYIEPVRKELMDKVDADHDRVYNMSRKVAELNGFKNTIWSMYEINGFDEKSNVPVGSKLLSYYSSKEHYVTVEGPTWLDCWKAADKLVKESSDDHGDHVFIEDFRSLKLKEGFYEVSLGS